MIRAYINATTKAVTRAVIPGLNSEWAKLAAIIAAYPETVTKYDGKIIPITDGYTFADWIAYKGSEETINQYKGNNVIRLDKFAEFGSPYCIKTFSSPIDLSNADYIDLYVYLPDYTTKIFQIDLYTNDSNYFSNNKTTIPNYVNIPGIYDDSYGWRKIRIPKSEWSVKAGTPAWNSISKIRVLPTYNAGDVGYVLFAKIEGVPIPKSLISIDFDDGNDNVFTNAYPVMKANSLTGSAFIITNTVGGAGKMTWANLKTLKDEGWLIGSHTHTHSVMTELSESELNTELQTSQNILASKGHIVSSRFIATPGGDWSELIYNRVKEYYLGARYGNSTIKDIIPNAHPLRFDYLSVLNTDTVQSLKDKVDDVIAKKYHHSFTFHSILETPSFSSQYSTANFTEFCEYVKTKVDAGLLEIVNMKDMITN